jgi:hypothetical protein
MLIQDMNHIEVAQAEILGASGRSLSFGSNNTFDAKVRGNVRFNGDVATIGGAADAIGGPGYRAFTKIDGETFVRPGVSSSTLTSASALLPNH